MRTMLSVILMLGLTTITTAEESGEAGGRQDEAKAIVSKAAAALKAVKSVSYTIDYKGTEWIAAHVPEIKGTIVMGGRSEHDIDRFFCELKITPSESSEVRELSAGSDGNEFFLVDPATKTVYQDMDIAVLGSAGRGIRRALLREFTDPEPFDEALQSGAMDLRDETKIGEEECYVVHLKPSDPPEMVWYFAKKDLLPRRVTRLYEREGKEGTTEMLLTDVVVNPTFVRSPFKPVVPKGYTQTDDFAP